MNNRIEEGLRRSVHQLPSVSVDQLADIPVVKMLDHDDVTRQANSPPRGKVLPWPKIAGLAACAAAFVVVFSSWYAQNQMVDSVIDLDVNPGFEITLNRREKVLDVSGLNREAQEILEGRAYRGWELDDTVDTLFSDMVEQGYMDGSHSTVLVSVEGGKAADTRQLQDLVSDQIALSLIDTDIRPQILLQELHGGKAIRLSAEELGITQGKMQLIQTLVDQDDTLDMEELAGYSIEELRDLADDRSLILYIEEKTYPAYEEPEEEPVAEPERAEPERSPPEEPSSQPESAVDPDSSVQSSSPLPVQPSSSSIPPESLPESQSRRSSPPSSANSGSGTSDYGSSSQDDSGDTWYSEPSSGDSSYSSIGGDSGYSSIESHDDDDDSDDDEDDNNDDAGDSGYDDDDDDD